MIGPSLKLRMPQVSTIPEACRSERFTGSLPGSILPYVCCTHNASWPSNHQTFFVLVAEQPQPKGIRPGAENSGFAKGRENLMG